jgi:murein DD-endopeptidase MepM/ murein hydrolase activator NlpD
LKYSRISSRYTYRRFHPVYKKYLPHLGVDYAAPIGTPVVALADGIIASAGRNGRAGKYVALTHYGVYRTAYSHLSKFGRGVKKGKKVHQGQVIGYVGTTGASTGPHLDFQLKKFGKPINPLSFKSPGGPPVKQAYKEAFMQNSIQKLYVLEETEKATIVAANNKAPKRKPHAKKVIASSIAKPNQSYN